MTTFFVESDNPRYLTAKYVSILSERDLTIFKSMDKGLVKVFSVHEAHCPDLDDVSDVWVYPSTRSPFGIILWTGEEVSYSRPIVILYVHDKFKIVFRGRASTAARFADIDGDGIPEIVEDHYPTEKSTTPDLSTIWTWNGAGFVKVPHAPTSAIFSTKIVDAIRRVKERSR